MRAAFDALMDVDDALASVVAEATQPALAAIKLAWWREALDRLDREPPPAEPRLTAAAAHLLPLGISGANLASLEGCWALILHSDEPELVMRGAAERGPAFFELGARLLGGTMDTSLLHAAQCFSSVDLARRGITQLPGQKLRRSKCRAARRLRPLTALAALARRDMRTGGPPFEPEATPARAWTLLRHRITGRW